MLAETDSFFQTAASLSSRSVNFFLKYDCDVNSFNNLILDKHESTQADKSRGSSGALMVGLHGSFDCS
jgi:hypothetical protein